MNCYRCNSWPCECSDGQTIICGDCREVLSLLEPVDLVLTDPPYGIDFNTDYTRFSGGLHDSKTFNSETGCRIAGDDVPFDPSPWLAFPRAILFGANCFSDKLPKGSWLVWCKKRESQLGKFMGDCEVAWMSGGHGVYLFHHIWNGHDMETERGARLHPTQKPAALMSWCIQKANRSGTILDPFMGSGATLVAAKRLGRKCIGIEIEEKYCEIAANRLANEPKPLFSEAV